MKKYLAGYYYDPHEDKEHKYYTDDYKNFYDEMINYSKMIF